MSLKDDLEAMERHERNGTLSEFLNGTAKPLPQESMPSDPTANGVRGDYDFIKARGE